MRNVKYYTIMKNDDYIVRDHRVHDVRIMPGVTFLDLVYKALSEEKYDISNIEIHEILFEEPVATSELYERKIQLEIMADDTEGTIVGRSQRMQNGKVLDGKWTENFKCKFVVGSKLTRNSIDVNAIKNEATTKKDMDECYSWARKVKIQHYEFMKALGTVYVTPKDKLGELHYSSLAKEYSAYAFLHPAVLDSSTIIPIEERIQKEYEIDGDEVKPYIPMYIKRFKVYERITGDCYVYIKEFKQEDNIARDIYKTDILIYSLEGILLAEFQELTYKKVRNKNLIEMLIQAPGSKEKNKRKRGRKKKSSFVQNVEPSEHGDMREYIVSELKGMLAQVIEEEIGKIEENVGFYDLGLDSSSLLLIVKMLEDRLNEKLYPTLLFEYTTIQELADFLNEQYSSCFQRNGKQETQKSVSQEVQNKELNLYTSVWKEQEIETIKEEEEYCIWLFDEDEALWNQLRTVNKNTILIQNGAKYQKHDSMHYIVNGMEEADYVTVIENLLADGMIPDKMIKNIPLQEELSLFAEQQRQMGMESIFLLSKVLAGMKSFKQISFYVLHYKNKGAEWEGYNPIHEGIAGFCKTVLEEKQTMQYKLIGLEEMNVKCILSELASDDSIDIEIEYREGRRFVKVNEKIDVSKQSAGRDFIKKDGVYLLTGGMGGLGQIFIEELSTQPGVKLIVCGRSELSTEKKRILEDWKKQNRFIEYQKVDITSYEDVKSLHERILRDHGRIDGIVHMAGINRDSYIIKKELDEFLSVCKPKVDGTIQLDRVFAEDDLDFFALFSSTTAIMGNAGQCDYAYANYVMNHFATYRNELVNLGKRNGKTVAINWPLWANGGMQVDKVKKDDLVESVGMIPMSNESGMQAFHFALTNSYEEVIVVEGIEERITAALEAYYDDGAVEEKDDKVELVAEAVDEGLPLPKQMPQDIAIIGVSGRYPQADNIMELWENLKAGKDCVVDIPKERWDNDKYYEKQKATPGKSYGRRGGFINNVDKFDALFFHISPREAETMDPQERIFLEEVYHAFEDAGYTKSALENSRVGVFVGAMWGQYEMLEGEVDGTFVTPASIHSAIANRVSYYFNFKGPSIAVDTMCSSSLTSVHLACKSILDGECEMAVAGGVNTSLHPNKYIYLSQNGFLSTDGTCRAFGEGGDGYVPGEGVGALILKSLSKAEQDGDYIYGVIKATALNHGGKASGYTVPNVNSQAEVISMALEKAKIDPRTISYVEAHGTGTSLGDPIEMLGLTKAFRNYTEDSQYCAIGSIKSNIGHLESAAGVAAITKVLLQLKYKQLVPSIHSEELNHNIDFHTTPFYVQNTLCEWKQTREEMEFAPKRAAVSAFGAGGSNAHVIIEEYRKEYKKATEGKASLDKENEIIILSATNEARLKESVSNLLNVLVSNKTEVAKPTNMVSEIEIAEEIKEVLSSEMQIRKDEIDHHFELDLLVEEVSVWEAISNLLMDKYKVVLSMDKLVHISELSHLAKMVWKELQASQQKQIAYEESESIRKDIHISDLAYTLQHGREEMNVRMAVVASTIEELVYKLRAYSNGKETDIFFGENKKEDKSQRIFQNKNIQSLVAQAAQNKDYNMLCELWVAGTKMNWSEIFQDREAERIWLPGYPFEKKRFWIEKAERIEKVDGNYLVSNRNIHPLIDENVSTFERMCFRKTLHKNEFYLMQHEINGKRIFPGAFSIEMAFAAINLALPSNEITELKDIQMSNMLSVDGADTKDVVVNVSFGENGEKEMGFQIVSACEEDEKGPMVYTKGKIGTNSDVTFESVSLEQLQEGLHKVASKEEVYNRFQEIHYSYGKEFQVVEEVRYSDKEALGTLELTELGRDWSEICNCSPSLVDGAFQVASLLLEMEAGVNYIPTGVQKISFDDSMGGELSSKYYAYVKEESNDNNQVYHYSIMILDSEGKQIIKMDQFEIRKMLAFVEFNKVEKEPIVILDDDIFNKTKSYLRKVITLCMRMEENELDESEHFEQYGLDSIIIMRLNDELGKHFKKLSKTIFFENSNLLELTQYFVKYHKEELINLFQGEHATILKEDNIELGDTGVCYLARKWIAMKRKTSERKIDTLVVFSLEPALAEAMKEYAEQVILVLPGESYVKENNATYRMNPSNKQDYVALLHDLSMDEEESIRILYAWTNQEIAFEVSNLEVQLEQALQYVFYLTKALCTYKKSIEFLYLMENRKGWEQPIYKSTSAYLKSIVEEEPNFKFKCIEAFELEKEGVAKEVFLEFGDSESWNMDILLQKRGRKVSVLDECNPLKEKRVQLKKQGVYLVTGAMGGIGYQIATYLASEYQAKLILVGRKPEDAGIREKMNALKQKGSQIIYVSGDVGIQEDVKHIMEEGRNVFGHIDGVVHSAGITMDSYLMHKKEEQIWSVIKPKVYGTVYLYEEMKQDTFDFMILFSSLAGLIGNVAQGDYSFGNCFMDHYATMQSQNVTSINWPLWKDGGMKVDKEVERYLAKQHGLTSLEKSDGMKAFEALLLEKGQNVAVFCGDKKKFLNKFGTKQREFSALANYSALSRKKSNATKMLPEVREYAQRPKKEQEEIAVIGLSGKYPMANDLDTLWANLCEGKDCITEIPKDRWDCDEFYTKNKDEVGKSYSKWGGFIEDIDKFDPLLFHISPRDAEIMSPEEKLFMMTAWHTFDDAGYTRKTLNEKRVGVFVGAMYSQYQLMRGMINQVEMSTMSFHADIANRVSFFYNLHGPSISVDTLCSSAMTAIHLACESIRSGESEMALAGGVNLSLHPNKYNILSLKKFVSTDGKCRSFGEGGDGYVPGEGCGAVLLKPLSKAIQDGDNIYGIIKATTINHGGKTNGYTVPNPKAQTQLIVDALEKANISAEHISYIEAHGTGTALGDPIEITGLTNAFRRDTEKKGYCSIGSIKSNIGHLEAASGIASLTKVLLQLKYKKFVPSLHSSEINHNLDLEETPFYVQQKVQEWKPTVVEQEGKKVVVPRTAGISAYGAGGTNVHVIVSEYQNDRKENELSKEQVILLSATDTVRLQESAKKLSQYIRKRVDDKQVQLRDIAHTLMFGREEMRERLAIVCASKAELVERLEQYCEGNIGRDIYVRNADKNIENQEDTSFAQGKDRREQAFAWVNGADIEWERDKESHIISLPGYPFKLSRYWIGSYDQTQQQPESKKEKSVVIEDSRSSNDSVNEIRPVNSMEASRNDYVGDEVILDIIEGNIGIIRLNDRVNRNVFSEVFRKGITKRLWEVEQNENIKVVIVTGYDNIFCMGATENQLNDIADEKSSFTDEPVLYKGLLQCKVPVISAIQGHASGGGFLLGLYGDMVILGKESVYSAVFMKYGFTPGMGATLILEEKLGRNLATEMMYTARYYTGEELERRGASVIVTEQNNVLNEAIKMARIIREKPRVSLIALKEELASRILERLDAIIEKEDAMHKRTFTSDEVKENIERYYINSNKTQKKVNVAKEEDVELKQIEAELANAVEHFDMSLVDDNFDEWFLAETEEIEMLEHMERLESIQVEKKNEDDMDMEAQLMDILNQLEDGNISINDALFLEEQING